MVAVTTSEEQEKHMKSDDDVGSALNLKQLSYLVALAEYGSMSAAASALSIAQPSISTGIARLERNVGTQLVLRVRMGIQMTEAGTLLARSGAEVIRQLDQALAAVRHLDSVPRGSVTIGLPAGLSLSLSVPLIETMYADHPDIRLSIIEGMSDEILRWLAEDRIDMGCVYGDPIDSELVFEPLMTEEFFLVTAADDWEGKIGPDGTAMEPVSPEVLAQLPLVTIGARGARSIQNKVENRFGIKLNVIATINSLPQIIEMVGRASAYAILTHGSVHKHVASGQLVLVPFQGAGLGLTSYLVTKRSRPISAAARTVEHCARSIIREVVARHRIRGVVAFDVADAN